VPEVDHPGIPATIVVEDGLAEVLLEGESLGRWSLYDVHAARLVSSAFSISLDGEEITFIADEPVDFAYKGVEHMAGVWARYKSMTMPRRLVAVGRSRRGTTPSRIPELREAMLLNLQTVGKSPSFSTPAPAAPADAPEPSPWAQRLDAYSNVPAPIDDPTEAMDEEVLALSERARTVDEGLDASEEKSGEPESAEPETTEPETTDTDTTETGTTEAQTTESEMTEAATTELEDTGHLEVVSADLETALDPEQPAPLRPGPGLIPRQVVRPRVEALWSSTEPPDWDAAWEEPPPHEEPYDDLPSDAALIFADEEPAGAIDQPVEIVGPEDHLSEPDPIQEQPAGIAEELRAVTTEEKTGPREVFLDLGNLEVEQAVPALAAPTDVEPVLEDMVEPDLELLFAGAPGSEGERSGLFGAVRSAFARNRGGTHEHQFVEAPGGIGIVRQICADCGYISIGVAD
jgi:hypothetical protein